MIYLDTSALIKRFVAEKGSEVVQALFRRSEPIATAKIAYAEAYAGLTRKHREGSLSRGDYEQICRRFELDWRFYVRVDLGDEVLSLARDLIKRGALRGFDAIHLASAVILENALGERVTFVAADKRLLRAAGREKLETLDVQG